MIIKTALGAACALLLTACPAFAVTLTNNNAKAQTVLVDHGNSQQKIDLAPGQSVNVDCPNKCGFYNTTFGFSRLAGGNSTVVVDHDGEVHMKGGQGDTLMPNGTR